jgi:hypothetical protein
MSFRALTTVAIGAIAGCSSSSSPVAADAGGQDASTADSSFPVGAGDAGAEGGGAGAFVGSWTCSGTQKLTFTTPTNTPPMMETSPAYSLAISTTAMGLAATVNGCTFTFSVAGDIASGSPPGQMCMSGSLLESNPKGSSDATYTNATLTLTGATTLTTAGSFTFTDSALLEDGGRELYAGTGSYTSTCHKP